MTKPKTLTSVTSAFRYLTDAGYKLTLQTLYRHKKSGLLREKSGGGYLVRTVNEYAQKNLEKPGVFTPPDAPILSGDKERLVKARADKVELEVKLKNGQLVPLADEIRRRVAVIVGMKTAMENHRATFTQLLMEKMKATHHGTDNGSNEWQQKALEDLVAESGHLYTDIVLRIFSEIGKQGGIDD